MQIIHWIFDKFLVAEFYWFEKRSREIAVDRMYNQIFGILFGNLWYFLIIVGLTYTHFTNIPSLWFSLPAFLIGSVAVIILNIFLERRKYIQNLLEEYRALNLEEKKELAKEGLYYRIIPIFSLFLIYIVLLCVAFAYQ